MSATGRTLALLEKQPDIDSVTLAENLWPKFMTGGQKLREKSIVAASLMLARLRKLPEA